MPGWGCVARSKGPSVPLPPKGKRRADLGHGSDVLEFVRVVRVRNVDAGEPVCKLDKVAGFLVPDPNGGIGPALRDQRRMLFKTGIE